MNPHPPQETDIIHEPTTDLRLYMPYLDDWEASEEEKHEFLLTLRDILMQFVDLGFGVDATQLVTWLADQESAGNLPSGVIASSDHKRIQNKSQSGTLAVSDMREESP
ncbi:MAG: hypothetical protein AAFX52_11955 [Pseudomonadota bacterium]